MVKIKAWFWAIRPFSISAAVVPVLVGSAFAFSGGKFSLFRFLMVLIAGILVQMATNLIDEYSDHARPEGEHKIPAPYKVIALGKLTAKEVKLGAFVCFGVATVIGIYLIYLCGCRFCSCLWELPRRPIFIRPAASLGKIGLGQPLVFAFGAGDGGRLVLCPGRLFYPGHFLAGAAVRLHRHGDSGLE